MAAGGGLRRPGEKTKLRKRSGFGTIRRGAVVDIGGACRRKTLVMDNSAYRRQKSFLASAYDGGKDSRT